MHTLLPLPVSNFVPFTRHASTTPIQAKFIETDDAETEPSKISPTIKPSLLLIEDHAVIVDCMLPILQREYDVTPASDMAEFHTALAEKSYALAVVDLTLHRKLDGLEMMSFLRTAGTRFIVFSGTAEEWHIRAAMRQGARGFVDKRKNLSVLCEALRAIAAGSLAFPPEIMEKLSGRKKEEFPSLGPAEKQFIDVVFAKLDLLIGNMPSNKVIAIEMQVSVSRTENILRELIFKFGILDGKRTSLLAELKARGYFPGAPLSSFDKLGIK